MMNILIIYYSQSGQIREILDEISKPLQIRDASVDFIEIKTLPKYPFPWKSEEFFSVFPDSKTGHDCQIEPLSIDRDKKYDLILLGLQVWYLEPSIPMASFLRSPYASVLMDTPVITVYGIRNMWVNAHKTIKMLVLNAGGKMVGNIVLQDIHNNLISVLTIIRWLIKGKKEAGKLLPHAGVDKEDILACRRFGAAIFEAKARDYTDLQDELIKLNAFKVDYHIMKTEFAGSRIFGLWAGIIQKKSLPGTKKRSRWLKIFKYYLFFVIFIISPISSLIFRTIRTIWRKKTDMDIRKHTSLV